MYKAAQSPHIYEIWKLTKFEGFHMDGNVSVLTWVLLEYPRLVWVDLFSGDQME